MKRINNKKKAKKKKQEKDLKFNISAKKKKNV
jgi:hypothetical protein